MGDYGRTGLIIRAGRVNGIILTDLQQAHHPPLLSLLVRAIWMFSKLEMEVCGTVGTRLMVGGDHGNPLEDLSAS